MRKISIAVLLSACCLATPLSAEVRWFGHLPTDGQGFAPYWCSGAKLVKAQIQGLPTDYQFKGTCQLVVKLPGGGMLVMDDVPLLATAEFDGAWASEVVDVAIGTVTSRIRCQQDPFRNGRSTCVAGSAEVNVSQKLAKGLIEMYPPQWSGTQEVPILAMVSSAILKAQSPLTAGPSGQQLDDWNPFAAGSAEPATIQIKSPASYAILPPGSAYAVSFAANARTGKPATVLVQFEGLEAVPKGGDVAMPAGKTHWWQPRASAEATWNALPLQIGTDRATRHLTGAGLYRVRGRAAQAGGNYQGGWTGWRTFCLGTQASCGNIGFLGKSGEETLKAVTDGLKSRISVPRAPIRRIP